jgi:hypothetical protein
MKTWNEIMQSPRRIAEIYGTLMAIALIVFFFVMYAVGLAHVLGLRLLNLGILLAGVYYAIKQYRRTHHGELNYFRAMAIGVGASTIGVTTFAFILFIFLRLDDNFMQHIITHERIGEYLNAYIASAAIMIEGVTSGCFVTYVLLNWISTTA